MVIVNNLSTGRTAIGTVVASFWDNQNGKVILGDSWLDTNNLEVEGKICVSRLKFSGDLYIYNNIDKEFLINMRILSNIYNI